MRPSNGTPRWSWLKEDCFSCVGRVELPDLAGRHSAFLRLLYGHSSALLLFTPSWTTLAGAAVVMVIAYIINQAFDARIGWEYGPFWYKGYLTPSGFVRNTFLNGYHPIFPWTAYAMVGMWLAHRPIFDRDGRRRHLLIFLPLTALLECAMSYPSFVHVLHNPHTGVAFVDGLLRVLESRPDALNMLGHTLVAISVILVCLELADRFRTSRIIEALATTGRMSLTHYLAHTLLVLGPMLVWGVLQQSRLVSFLIACGFFAAAVSFSKIYSKRYKLGPLEAVMCDASPGSVLHPEVVRQLREWLANPASYAAMVCQSPFPATAAPHRWPVRRCKPGRWS